MKNSKVLNDQSRLLRFAVLTTGKTFTLFQEMCISNIINMGGITIAGLIIDENDPSTLYGMEPNNIDGWSKKLWAIYRSFTIKFFSQALKSVGTLPVFSGEALLSCNTMTDEHGFRYFSADDINRMRMYDLDFILYFGSGGITGEIINLPRYGVWSFYYGDISRHSCFPESFWEIYRQDNISGALLMRIREENIGGVTLKKGFFKTIDTSYNRNLDNLLFQAVEWPAIVCADILNGHAGYIEGEPSNSCSSDFQRPQFMQVLLFFLILIKNKILSIYEGLFYSCEMWNVGIINMPIHKFLTAPAHTEVSWMPNTGSSKFIADPFGIKTGNGLNIFYEDYDYKVGKGCISTAMVNDGSVSAAAAVIETDFHMSYPYLFRYNNNIYCVPESSESKEVALYKSDSFPEGWSKVATLIENFAGVDSTIFQYNGHWWLMATDAEDSPYHKLKIWYAEDLLGPWEEHLSNPVKIDIRSARPAGTPFFYKGYLYRPSQDCSTSYGGRIILNRVLSLSPYDYHEEEVAVIEPDEDGPYPDGLHTISSVGDITLIDGKKRVFVGKSLYMTIYKIRQIRGKLFG